MGWELITPDSLAELDSSQNTKLGGISTEANKTTFPTNNTEGQFSFAIDGTTTTNDVFSSAERTKLNRLRAGQAPDDASVSIKNNAITISKSGSAIRLNNAGGFGDITFSNSDVGLSNVTNNAQVRQDLVGAPNAIKNSQVTISKSGSAIRLNNAGGFGDITFSNSDVGLSNVTNNAQVRQDLVGAPNAIKNSQVTTNANGTLNNAGGGTAPNINDIPDSGSTKTGATRANNAIDASYRVIGNLYNGSTARSITDVLGARDRAYAAIDSSNRITANIFDGTNSISPGNVYTGATRANAGLDSNGNVDRAVPLTKLSNLNTYSVDYQVVTWNKISNAGYVPSATSQLITVTWKRASDGAVLCTSTWNATISTSSNTVTTGGTINANASGSGASNTSQVGGNSSLSTVTFSRGGVSVTCTAKVSVLSGFSFKEE